MHATNRRLSYRPIQGQGAKSETSALSIKLEQSKEMKKNAVPVKGLCDSYYWYSQILLALLPVLDQVSLGLLLVVENSLGQ